MRRVLTALLLTPVGVGLIFFGSPLAVYLAITVVALLCLREALGIIGAYGIEPYRPVAYAAGAVMILTSAGAHVSFLSGVAILLLILSLQKVRHAQALYAAAATYFAIFYACAPFALARHLYDLSPHWLFAVFLVTWAGDTSALYVGRAFGRRKLAPSISPRKTWEGAIASGVLGAAAGSAYLLYFRPADIGSWIAIPLPLLANVAGQLGDLSESVLKRGANLKDSGGLLPGHGGVLDRMDGALFAFPAAYLFLMLAGHLR